MKPLSVLLAFFLTVLLSSYSKPKTLWVAIGDSITYLNEHPEETDHRITKGYMTRIKEKFPYVEYYNQGHNGWTVIQIAEAFDKLGVQKADIYSIFLGTNDWWHGNTLGSLDDYKNSTGHATVMGAFRTIVNKIKDINPKATIVLITPMQRGDFVYINDFNNNAVGSYKEKNGQKLSSFAEAIKQIGQLEHLEVIDLYHDPLLSVEHAVKFKWLRDPRSGVYNRYKFPEYTYITFNPGKDEYPYPKSAMDMTYDGLHPSDAGYKEIAKVLEPVFKKF